MTCFFCLCPSWSDCVRQCDLSQWFFGHLPLGSQPPLPLPGVWLAQIPGQMVRNWLADWHWQGDWHWLSWPGLLSWHPRVYGCLLQISCHQGLQPCWVSYKEPGTSYPLLCPWGRYLDLCLFIAFMLKVKWGNKGVISTTRHSHCPRLGPPSEEIGWKEIGESQLFQSPIFIRDPEQTNHTQND